MFCEVRVVEFIWGIVPEEGLWIIKMGLKFEISKNQILVHLEKKTTGCRIFWSTTKYFIEQ